MDINEIISIGGRVLDDARNGNHQVQTVNDLFPPSLYYRFFRLLAERLKPAVSVVLGVCGGGDCYHLCLGNPDGDVIGVDIVRDHPAQMEHIEKHCPKFLFWEGDSVLSAEEIFLEFGPIEFLFIDTTHVLDATLAELNAWKPYLAPGAVVCFDDLFRTEMAGVWETIPEPKVRMDSLHDGTPDVGGGFGVWVNV